MPKSHARVEIKASLFNSLTIISGLVFLTWYLWSNRDKYEANLGAPLFATFASLVLGVLFFRIYRLTKRETIMAIDGHGIYHKDHGLLQWNDILSIKKTRKSSADSENTYLLIQTSLTPKPHEIPISNMQLSEKDLVEAIRKHREYNVIEVPYDEW